jgi:hypothetical protein
MSVGECSLGSKYSILQDVPDPLALAWLGSTGMLLCWLVCFCVQGVTSYVIVRPLCTALALITSQFGAYSEGELTPNKAYPYLAMATNVSQVRYTAAQQPKPLCPVAKLT